jgi:cytochrome b subunit of formate dehydrogenase
MTIEQKFDLRSMTKKLDYETNNKACDSYGSLDRYTSLKFKEVFANMTRAISKVGPFKTWILTPASSVWIQLVSLTGMFVTGILLFLNLFNFIAKFSKIPWNFFEMAFCCAMSFCYFTCGLHLFIKGSKIYVSSTIEIIHNWK